jgi:hypothetical protein
MSVWIRFLGHAYIRGEVEMETTICGWRERLNRLLTMTMGLFWFESRPATRARFAAVLALLFCSQPASAVISISPSPSYNGSYTVNWSSPLGCWEELVEGFWQSWCLEIQEQTGSGHFHTVATSGNSLNISGKSANTYTYRYIVHYSGFWVNGSYPSGTPVSVQVILPLPSPNSFYQQTSGPVNNPQSYRLVWNATNATSCALNISWYRYQHTLPSHVVSGTVATSGQYNDIIKYWSNLDYVRARTTCNGPGGSNYEEWHIDFNQFATP